MSTKSKAGLILRKLLCYTSCITAQIAQRIAQKNGLTRRTAIKAISLHDKSEIEEFLRHNTFLHLYSIGDLDDFFWPYTTWYALKNHEHITQLALLYSGMPLPVLLAITGDSGDDMRELLRSIIHLLPKRFYGHLSGDTATIFANDYKIHDYGTHYKMALLDTTRLNTFDTAIAVPLTTADLPELEALYRASYPGNSFDPRMLETGSYYGIWRGKSLISVAGVHVLSRQFKVAALGNVTTHPDFRGQHLGATVCAKLCQSLLPTVDHIGLNVKADNASAIACYKSLGFEVIATYGEYAFESQLAQ